MSGIGAVHTMLTGWAVIEDCFQVAAHSSELLSFVINRIMGFSVADLLASLKLAKEVGQ